MTISGRARIAGVIGWPVAQSRSPLMHNHWISTLGLEAAYVPLAVKPEDLEQAVVGGWADGYTNAVFRLLAHLKSPKRGLVGPWAHKYPHFAWPKPRCAPPLTTVSFPSSPW